MGGPPLFGAIYVVALTLRALATPSEDGDLGAQARQIETFVTGRFQGELHRIALAVLAASVVLGAMLGLAARALLSLRKRLHPGRSFGRRARPLAAAALVVGLHAALELWGLAHDPQLYASAWYARGGWRRTVQVVATDWLGPRGVVLLFVLALLWFL
ncbi:MAG TPA: hypothetical protein VKU41_08075, partial [Polyangiaceae bacterium]|nr:hypothetical protein [Polyangiaceae bacterium]